MQPLKATVKFTGEIVRVTRTPDGKFITSDGTIYSKSELKF